MISESEKRLIPGAVKAVDLCSDSEAQSEEHPASLKDAKKINAKSKYFARVNGMVKNILVNPIVSNMETALFGGRGNRTTEISTPSYELDLALV